MSLRFIVLTVRKRIGEPSYRFGSEANMMNWHTIRNIVNHIKKQGRLPVDPYGQYLSVDAMVDWFDLRSRLNPVELRHIKKELTSLIDAEMLLVELEAESI